VCPPRKLYSNWKECDRSVNVIIAWRKARLCWKGAIIVYISSFVLCYYSLFVLRYYSLQSKQLLHSSHSTRRRRMQFLTNQHTPWENYISISFKIEWDMIVVTVFLSILNQMELHLVQNRKENCHHDHIPFNLKGNGNIVLSVQRPNIIYNFY